MERTHTHTIGKHERWDIMFSKVTDVFALILLQYFSMLAVAIAVTQVKRDFSTLQLKKTFQDECNGERSIIGTNWNGACRPLNLTTKWMAYTIQS